MKPSLVFASGLLALAFSNQALAGRSQFECEYQSHSGSHATISFEAPEGFDLTNPPARTKSVPFKINGATEPVEFEVKETVLHVGGTVTYFHRDAYFINDLYITYRVDYSAGNSFKGTWMTDTSPALNLECSFLN